MKDVTLKNINILKHISIHCNTIEIALKSVNYDYELFFKNIIVRDAVSMNLLQIGELSGHLSDEFKQNASDIPWREIRAMRNLFAHNYSNMDVQKIWHTAKDDAPALKSFCQKVIKEHEMLNQDAIIPDYDDEEDCEI